MRPILCLLVVLVLVGCGDSDVERRRQHSLERMEWRGGTADEQRVQRLIVAALRGADAESLAKPQLVNVTMGISRDNPHRGYMRVDWIAAAPEAEGIRIRFSDGSEKDIMFSGLELDSNRKEARDLVLFGATPFTEQDHEHEEVWQKLLAERTASVVLLSDGKPISNKQSIHPVEFGG